MKRTDMLGIRVTLREDKVIPRQLIDMTLGETEYHKGDTFIVEHDFRDTDDDGIHVGCPEVVNGIYTRGPWMALTSEQFAELFGDDALARLDAIRYDVESCTDA